MVVATVVLTVAILTGLGIQQWNLLRFITDLKEQHIPMTELSGTIIHADDMLTDSTYLTLLTGLNKWSDRYKKFQPSLEYSAGRLVSLAESATPETELRKLHQLRIELSQIEQNALELAQNGSLGKAFELMNGPKYQEKKRLYTQTLYEITGGFAKTRSDTLEKQQLIARFTLIAFLVSFAALIATGIILMRLFQQAERQRKKIQTQLSMASKLASLGTLSSGIAHELRTPLTVVKGMAQQIELNGKAPQAVREQAQQIIQESARMELITNHLRSFAREGGSGEWKGLSLNEPITHSLALLDQQLKHRGIEVKLSLDPQLPSILGQMGQLESVFQNLITNSRDAFQEQGGDKPKVIEISTLPTSDGGARVIFSDRAGGMAPEVKERIFDPFFTTKGTRGIGLGLSIVHGIVEQHKGVIQVETELGSHTTITLEFPPYAMTIGADNPRAAAAA
jgi:signal transduction histidine kinase